MKTRSPIPTFRTRDAIRFERSSFGARLRKLRKDNGWTLAEVAARTGIALSTISKAERGQVSLTYDRLVQLARGLNIDFGAMFSNGNASGADQVIAVTRRGKAKRLETDCYVYGMLCTERRGKRMVPILGRIKARSMEEFETLIRHPGEEFLYVLEGVLSVRIDGCAPMKLHAGDSIYFDSGRAHAYLSTGKRDAVVLVVCWQTDGADELPSRQL